MNNKILELEILQQIKQANNFKSICKIKAYQDDNMIDKDEQKKLKKIEKITNQYINNLSKLTK